MWWVNICHHGNRVIRWTSKVINLVFLFLSRSADGPRSDIFLLSYRLSQYFHSHVMRDLSRNLKRHGALNWNFDCIAYSHYREHISEADWSLQEWDTHDLQSRICSWKVFIDCFERQPRHAAAVPEKWNKQGTVHMKVFMGPYSAPQSLFHSVLSSVLPHLVNHRAE